MSYAISQAQQIVKDQETSVKWIAQVTKERTNILFINH